MAVTIRITHNRKNKYLPTSIYVDKTQISRDGKTIRDATVRDTIDDKIKKMRQAFLKIKFPDALTVEQIASIINDIIKGNSPDTFKLDLFDYSEILMRRMEPKTAEGYRTSLNAVKRFIGKDRLDINEINTSWVRRFREFLETEPAVENKGGKVARKDGRYPKKTQGCRAISYYMGCLRSIHNKARQEFNDDDTNEIRIPRQPFARKELIPPMPLTEHRTVTVDEIRAIMELDTSSNPKVALARDVFMLSFMLAGTNTIDLFNARATDLDGDLLTYCRAKTDSTRYDKAKITLKMLPMAMEILERHKGRGGYLFDFHLRYSNSHEFNRAVNKGLKEVAQLADIEGNLTTYYARHSWATIARNVCGIDRDTVNAALDHASTGNDRINDIYIAKSFAAIWKAQEAVMAELMKNDEKTAIFAVV